MITLAIFTIIFGQLAGMDSEGFPYPVFVIVALVPWTFFSSGISQAGLSLVNQQQLLTKVYFPRLFIPTGAVLSFLVDMAISALLSCGLLVYYRQPPSPWAVTLPFLVALNILVTLGIGYFLAAVTVFYRDFRYVVPFLVQILMYASPVIYSARIFKGYSWLLGLNPMAGIIGGYRSAVLGDALGPAATGDLDRRRRSPCSPAAWPSSAGSSAISPTSPEYRDHPDDVGSAARPGPGPRRRTRAARPEPRHPDPTAETARHGNDPSRDQRSEPGQVVPHRAPERPRPRRVVP